MPILRSPLSWIGGKYYQSSFILSHFPPEDAYTLYCEPFAGGCHVLARKAFNPSHIEVINDTHGDLINFWMHVRDHSDKLVERLSSLPYSRELYYRYHSEVRYGKIEDPLERAVRWFYACRTGFNTETMRSSPTGWAFSRSGNKKRVVAYHNVLKLFSRMSERLRFVEIDCQDFSKVLLQRQAPTTFFYVDPPYIGTERYYKGFAMEDHRRLAELLNSTPAKVALSYYDHPLVDELYPNWRRAESMHTKASQKRATKDRAKELLLCNYPENGNLGLLKGD
jgi:DNA adenine methylase